MISINYEKVKCYNYVKKSELVAAVTASVGAFEQLLKLFQLMTAEVSVLWKVRLMRMLINTDYRDVAKSRYNSSNRRAHV